MSRGTEAGHTSHPLAHRDGIAVVLGLLFGAGAMCPECGFGTRVTSKRWAKCKRCGARVARRPMEDVSAEIEARIAKARPDEGTA